MSAPDRVETERLLGERLAESHLPDLRRLDTDPRVMASLGPLRNEAHTRAFLEREMGHWHAHGFGLWAFRSRAEGAFVGRGGLRISEFEGERCIEVAYALVAEAWSQGFASEIAALSVRTAFEDLGLHEIVGFTLIRNAASRRVLERAGLRFEREGERAGLPHVLLRLSRSEWDGPLP